MLSLTKKLNSVCQSAAGVVSCVKKCATQASTAAQDKIEEWFHITTPELPLSKDLQPHWLDHQALKTNAQPYQKEALTTPILIHDYAMLEKRTPSYRITMQKYSFLKMYMQSQLKNQQKLNQPLHDDLDWIKGQFKNFDASEGYSYKDFFLDYLCENKLGHQDIPFEASVIMNSFFKEIIQEQSDEFKSNSKYQNTYLYQRCLDLVNQGTIIPFFIVESILQTIHAVDDGYIIGPFLVSFGAPARRYMSEFKKLGFEDKLARLKKAYTDCFLQKVLLKS